MAVISVLVALMSADIKQVWRDRKNFNWTLIRFQKAKRASFGIRALMRRSPWVTWTESMHRIEANNAMNADRQKRRSFVAPLLPAGYGER